MDRRTWLKGVIGGMAGAGALIVTASPEEITAFAAPGKEVGLSDAPGVFAKGKRWEGGERLYYQNPNGTFDFFGWITQVDIRKDRSEIDITPRPLWRDAGIYNAYHRMFYRTYVEVRVHAIATWHMNERASFKPEHDHILVWEQPEKESTTLAYR